jgi:hypothetical protein
VRGFKFEHRRVTPALDAAASTPQHVVGMQMQRERLTGSSSDDDSCRNCCSRHTGSELPAKQPQPTLVPCRAVLCCLACSLPAARALSEQQVVDVLTAAISHDGVKCAEANNSSHPESFPLLFRVVSSLSSRLSAQRSVELLQLAAHYL